MVALERQQGIQEPTLGAQVQAQPSAKKGFKRAFFVLLFKLEQVLSLKVIKSKCPRLDDFAHCLTVQHCQFVFVSPNPIPG